MALENAPRFVLRVREFTALLLLTARENASLKILVSASAVRHALEVVRKALFESTSLRQSRSASGSRRFLQSSAKAYLLLPYAPLQDAIARRK